MESSSIGEFPVSAITSCTTASVILNGCADDLVVSDPGRQYACRSVCSDRPVRPVAAESAKIASIAGRPLAPVSGPAAEGSRTVIDSSACADRHVAEVEVAEVEVKVHRS